MSGSSFNDRLRSALPAGASDPARDTSSSLCTTVRGPSPSGGDSFWLQVHAGLINFQHLDAPEKDEVLGRILDAPGIPEEIELEAGVFVTFAVHPLSDSDLESLLAALIGDYFEVADPASLEISTEEL